MRAGDLLWVRATLVQATPKALLISVQGPGGSPITYAIDPASVMLPYHTKPTPEDPTQAL